MTTQELEQEIERTREHLGPTDLGIMHFRKLVMDAARALQQGEAPSHLAHQDRYTVRSGACVTSKAKDLPAVMIEPCGSGERLTFERDIGERIAAPQCERLLVRLQGVRVSVGAGRRTRRRGELAELASIQRLPH